MLPFPAPLVGRVVRFLAARRSPEDAEEWLARYPESAWPLEVWEFLASVYRKGKRNVSAIASPGVGFVTTHASVWDYDRRVPILFWRKGMRTAPREDHISTVNILPTIAAQIGLVLPAGLDGRCLSGVEGVACPVR